MNINKEMNASTRAYVWTQPTSHCKRIHIKYVLSKSCGLGLVLFSWYNIPVSYTHLDVYKRQI